MTLGFWLGSAAIASIEMLIMTWWIRKENPDTTMNLAELITMIALCLIPYVNTGTAGVLLATLLFNVAPEITVFKGRE
jgi:hypothetical protein